MRSVIAIALILGGFVAPAHGQVAESWLRNSLRPTRPVSRKGPSTAVFPPQTVNLRFSHKQHVEAEVNCEQCHDAVSESRKAGDRNIPAHPQCETCHDIAAAERGETTDPVSTCVACHPGAVAGNPEVAKSTFDGANIHFSHQLHLKKGAKCADCHAGVETVELASLANVPRMAPASTGGGVKEASCLGCHDGRAAPNRCQTCHVSEPDGVLRTKFATGLLVPSGTLRDDDHARDFLKRHSRVARMDAEPCMACHRAVECETCLASSSKAFRIHPADWVQAHGIVSRGQEMDCQACHREQDFCVSCHQQMGIAKESKLRQPGTRLATARFHPVGFVRGANGEIVRDGPEHHSFAAQANMASCVGCHTESTCMGCHSTSGVTAQISPHPAGFAQSSAACRGLRSSPVACAKCHGGAQGLAAVGAQMPGCE